MFNPHLILTNDKVTIKILTPNSFDKLVVAASAPEIWQHHRFEFWKSGIFKSAWFDKAITQMQTKKRWPFLIEWEGELIGSSSYYDIDPENKRLKIGYTWYHPKFWGTALNPSVKYLLLKHAFETLGFLRVAFSVDETNLRSRHALQKLGFKQEGILRRNIVYADGTSENSVIFAVTIDDWSSIKAQLLKIIESQYANH